MSKKEYKFKGNSMPPHLEKRFLKYLRDQAETRRPSYLNHVLEGYEAGKKGLIPNSVRHYWEHFLAKKLR